MTKPYKLTVKVIANASKDEVVGCLDNKLKVKVKAKAQQGKANKAVLSLLAKELNLSKSQLAIISGLQSNIKTIQIRELSQAQLLDRFKTII